jgi:hypothetical protein
MPAFAGMTARVDSKRTVKPLSFPRKQESSKLLGSKTPDFKSTQQGDGMDWVGQVGQKLFAMH